MAVGLDLLAERRMAAVAGFVAVHSGGQLVVGVAVVHGVTIQARHAAALKAGRFHQPVKLARDAHHAIGPGGRFDKLRPVHFARRTMASSCGKWRRFPTATATTASTGSAGWATA